MKVILVRSLLLRGRGALSTEPYELFELRKQIANAENGWYATQPFDFTLLVDQMNAHYKHSHAVRAFLIWLRIFAKELADIHAQDASSKIDMPSVVTKIRTISEKFHEKHPHKPSPGTTPEMVQNYESNRLNSFLKNMGLIHIFVIPYNLEELQLQYKACRKLYNYIASKRDVEKYFNDLTLLEPFGEKD